MSTPTFTIGKPDAAGLAEQGRRLLIVGLRQYGILFALAALVVVVQVQNSSFLGQTNLLNIGQQWSSILIMAVGMTFVLVGRGFDLSVGAVYAFSATLAGAMPAHHSGALTLVTVLALGAGVGLVNGLAVTRLNINPFITTLATAQVIRGFAYIWSNGKNYVSLGGLFDTLGAGYVGAVPVPFIIALAVAAIGTVVLAFSVYGRGVYATGGNDEASYLSGMPTDLIRISTYVISGLTAALAGAIYLGRIGSGQANVGIGIEFDVIAAALIGGISIAGGDGAVWRAVAGVALLAVLQNFFNLQNIGDFWQMVTKGLIILAAVGIDSYSKRRVRRTIAARLHTLADTLRRRTPTRTGG